MPSEITARKATLQLACAIEVLLIMCNFTSIADTRRIWQYVLGIHSLLMLVLLGPELALVLQRRKHVQSTKPATGDDEAPSPQASRSTLAMDRQSTSLTPETTVSDVS